MKFSIYDYLLPSLIPYLLSVALVIGYIILVLYKRPKSTRLIWGGLVVTVGFMLVVLAYIYPAITRTGPLLSNPNRFDTSGVVENIRSAGRTHIYYDQLEGDFTTASYISISGTEYYLLSDCGIDVGQKIYLRYCPEGNAVVEWDVVPLTPFSSLQTQAADLVSSPGITIPYMRAEVLIAIWGCIVIVLRIFEGPISKLRLAYIMSHETVRKQEVLPRKTSIATCLTETLVTLSFVSSLATHSLVLIGFLGILTSILWLLQWITQKTVIWYGDRNIFYTFMGETSMFSLDDIKNVCMVPTRISGCCQLEIRLTTGQKISINQLHFTGLKEFYNWLNMADN